MHTSISTPEYFSSCEDIYRKLDLNRVPAHIAIIMDGNGRWAKEKGWMRVKGHEHATLAVRESTRGAGELGIKALSLFAFSTENWSRPKEEVDFLFHLFERTLEGEQQELAANNVRLQITGDREPLPERLNKTIDKVMAALHSNTGLILNLAVNYGGKQDILQAANKAMGLKEKGRELKITEEELRTQLQTGELPDVDLLIRTSGELRISNFFLWQAAYAELYFPSIYWPDFRRQHVLEAVWEYQRRDRRYGGLK